jgi:hypothetical protein
LILKFIGILKMKLTTTLLATLIFASTGAIANTKGLNEQDELLIQRAERIHLRSCALAQFQKLSNNPEKLVELQSVFHTMKDNIEAFVIENGFNISSRDSNSSFTVDDAAIMLVASCIAPARN